MTRHKVSKWGIGIVAALDTALVAWARFAHPHLTDTELLLQFWWVWLIVILSLFAAGAAAHYWETH